MNDKKQPLQIGYFGIEGSFTYSAARAYFPKNSTFVGISSFQEIFQNVASREVDAGIIPIENTLAGSIYENYDLFDDYDLVISGEVSRKVEHFLLVHKSDSNIPKDDFRSIKKVYSHQKAIEQCSDFFAKHPWIEKIDYADTAKAAKFVSEQNDPTIAAIAGKDTINHYNLSIAKSNIENNKYNYTRFLAIAPKGDEPTKTANKCSLIVRLKHVAGSLSSTLALITNEGCNLTKIESRPMHDHPYEYVFYLDFVFDPAAHSVTEIIDTLTKNVESLKVLGVYKDERTFQN